MMIVIYKTNIGKFAGPHPQDQGYNWKKKER